MEQQDDQLSWFESALEMSSSTFDAQRSAFDRYMTTNEDRYLAEALHYGDLTPSMWWRLAARDARPPESMLVSGNSPQSTGADAGTEVDFTTDFEFDLEPESGSGWILTPTTSGVDDETDSFYTALESATASLDASSSSGDADDEASWREPAAEDRGNVIGTRDTGYDADESDSDGSEGT